MCHQILALTNVWWVISRVNLVVSPNLCMEQSTLSSLIRHVWLWQISITCEWSEAWTVLVPLELLPLGHPATARIPTMLHCARRLNTVHWTLRRGAVHVIPQSAWKLMLALWRPLRSVVSAVYYFTYSARGGQIKTTAKTVIFDFVAKLKYFFCYSGFRWLCQK